MTDEYEAYNDGVNWREEYRKLEKSHIIFLVSGETNRFFSTDLKQVREKILKDRIFIRGDFCRYLYMNKLKTYKKYLKPEDIMQPEKIMEFLYNLPFGQRLTAYYIPEWDFKD